MTITYLVYEVSAAAGGELHVATKEQWNRIMEQNRSLPRDKRRFFVQDCIDDCGSLDCLYIETTKADYDKWHSAHQVRYKKRKDSEDIVILSGDTSTQTENGTLLDTLSDDINWEEQMIDGIRMKELREALAAWRSWAVEMLDLYMAGMKTKASRILSEKYGVSQKTIRERKCAFEAFVLNFLK